MTTTHSIKSSPLQHVTPITKDEFSCFELRKNEFIQYVFFCAWFYSLDTLSVKFTHSVLHSRHLFTFIAIPHVTDYLILLFSYPLSC